MRAQHAARKTVGRARSFDPSGFDHLRLRRHHRRKRRRRPAAPPLLPLTPPPPSPPSSAGRGGSSAGSGAGGWATWGAIDGGAGTIVSDIDAASWDGARIDIFGLGNVRGSAADVGS